jgi:hypothetical protein
MTLPPPLESFQNTRPFKSFILNKIAYSI